MVNNGIKKILDLYKNGKINAKEAEIMLSNVECRALLIENMAI